MKNLSYLILIVIFYINNVFSANWETIYTGQNNILRGVFFINVSTGFVVGDGVISKTTNSGTNWTISNVRFNLRSVYFIDAQTGFAIGKSNDSGFVLKTTNSGISWNNQYVGFLSSGYDYQRIFFVNSTAGYIMHQSSVWYKTSNAGLFWVLNNPLSGYNIRDIGRSSSFFYAVGRSTGSQLKPAYWTSNDEINYGSAILCNECSNGDYGQRMKVFDTISYLVTGSSLESPHDLYRKSNLNPIWQSIGGGNYIQTYFVNENYIFYCSYGVPNSSSSASSNGGTSWIRDTLFSVGARNIFFVNTSIGFVVGDNGLIAKTTNGGGVIGIQQISNEFPKKFKLNQNYPNPFNPITIIEFDIVKSGNVKITIFDILGKEIVNLVDQELQAGSYQVDWDAINYPSGMYFYTIETNNYSETKKMVLCK